MMGNEEDFELLDVHEESEWSEGHLPSAIHLGKSIIERDIEKVIPNPKRKLIPYTAALVFARRWLRRGLKKWGIKMCYKWTVVLGLGARRNFRLLCIKIRYGLRSRIFN